MTLNTKDLYHGSVGVGTTAPYQTVPAFAIVDEFGEQISSFGGSGGSGGVTVLSPTTTSVASTTASTTIIASNASRKGISVANDSTATLRLSFTNPATSTNSFIALPANSFILLDQQLIITNAIYGIWSSANGTAQVTEYV